MAPKPPHFSWVIDGLLAGMARPYNVRQAFEFLKDAGIGVVVSLTRHSLTASFVEEFGFEYHHMPVKDFHAPTHKQMAKFGDLVDEAERAGKKLVVHCLAGVGRTGTMLASYLMHRGRTAQEAIAEIRRLRPGSIETAEQEEALHSYARAMRERK